MKKRLFKLLGVVLLVTSVLFGCKPAAKPKTNYIYLDYNVLREETPKQVQQELGNNLFVDAKVSVLSSDTVYFAKPIEIAWQNFSFIKNNQIAEKSSITSIYDANQAELFQLVDGSYFEVGHGYIEYNDNEFYKYRDILWIDNQLKFDEIASSFQKIDQQAVETFPLFNELYSSLCDIPETSIDITAYKLDVETLEYKQAQLESAKEQQISWCEKDEAILCVFKKKINEASLFHKGYQIYYSDRIIQNNYAVAIFNKDKLICFYSHGNYQLTPILKHAKLISLENAVDVIQNKFKNIHFFQKAVFDNISLQYAIKEMTVEEKTYNLVPTWVFELNEQVSYEEFAKTYFFIDATTGEELEWGGIYQ